MHGEMDLGGSGEPARKFGRAGSAIKHLRGFEKLTLQSRDKLIEMADELEELYQSGEKSGKEFARSVDRVLDLNQELASDYYASERFLEAADLIARVCAFQSKKQAVL